MYVTFSECVEKVALLALPGLLREDLGLFICSEEQHTSSEDATGNPVIVFNGADPFKSDNYDIYVDGEKIISVKSMSRAFSILIASYFVMNIAYPTTMVKSLTFLQKVILNLQDSLAKVKPVVTLLTNLNRK